LLRPGVTEAETYGMNYVFVEVDQQAVPQRIPFGVGLKVNPEWKSPNAGDHTKQGARQAIGWIRRNTREIRRSTVVVLQARISPGVMKCVRRRFCGSDIDPVGIRLVNVRIALSEA